MSEECKKKSEAASEAEEDEELNESRAFVELTEYIANAVEVPYTCRTFVMYHTLCGLTSVSLRSSFGATIYNLLFLGVCFNMLICLFFCFFLTWT